MKTILWILLVAVIVTILAVPLVAKAKEPAVEVRKLTPEDREIIEEWERVTTVPDVLGVSAARLKRAKWNWQIFINSAEFVRRDPLASRLDAKIIGALTQVKGVSAVARQDTEIWVVQGNANGADLVRACATVLDQLEPDIRKHLEEISR